MAHTQTHTDTNNTNNALTTATVLIVHTQPSHTHHTLLTSVHATCARVAPWRRPVEVGRYRAVDVGRGLSGLILRAPGVAELGTETREEAGLLRWFGLPQSEGTMAECMRGFS